MSASETQTREENSRFKPYFSDKSSPAKPRFETIFSRNMADAIKERRAPWHQVNRAPDDIIPPPRNGVSKYQYPGATGINLMLRPNGPDGKPKDEQDFFNFSQVNKMNARLYAHTHGSKAQDFFKLPNGSYDYNVITLHPASNVNTIAQQRRETGWEPSRPDAEKRHERAEEILRTCGAKIVENPKVSGPAYDHKNDTIHLPPNKPESIRGLDAYYDKAMQAVIKSTGHKNRGQGFTPRNTIEAVPGSPGHMVETLQNGLTTSFLYKQLALPHDVSKENSMAREMAGFCIRQPNALCQMANEASKIAYKLLEPERERLKAEAKEREERKDRGESNQSYTDERNTNDQRDQGAEMDDWRSGTDENQLDSTGQEFVMSYDDSPDQDIGGELENYSDKEINDALEAANQEVEARGKTKEQRAENEVPTEESIEADKEKEQKREKEKDIEKEKGDTGEKKRAGKKKGQER